MSDNKTFPEPSVTFLLLLNASVAFVSYIWLLIQSDFRVEELIMYSILLTLSMGALSVYAAGFYFLQRKKPFTKRLRILFEILPGICIVILTLTFILYSYWTDPLRGLPVHKDTPAIIEKIKNGPPQPPAQPARSGNILLVAPEPDNSASILMDAINSAKDGDTILLAAGIYYQSAAAGRDAPITIENKKDLTIISQGDAYVLCEKGAALPIEIMNSERIRIENIRFGHAGHPGQTCTGSVIWLFNAKDITIKNCVLYGSGFNAIAGGSNKRILVEGCALTECTHQSIDLSLTEDLTVRNNFIAYNCIDTEAGCLFDFAKNKRILVTGNLIARNLSCFKHERDVESLSFVHNVFFANHFDIPPEISRKNSEWGSDLQTVEEMFTEKEIWRDPSVIDAAKAHLEFVEVLNGFDYEKHH